MLLRVFAIVVLVTPALAQTSRGGVAEVMNELDLSAIYAEFERSDGRADFRHIILCCSRACCCMATALE